MAKKNRIRKQEVIENFTYQSREDPMRKQVSFDSMTLEWNLR